MKKGRPKKEVKKVAIARKDPIKWNKQRCKLCNNCINICPVNNLFFKHNILHSRGLCISCHMCEKYCPDIAIDILTIKRKITKIKKKPIKKRRKIGKKTRSRK